MALPGGKMGVCRPIRGVPGSIKKLVGEVVVETEAQSQEINKIKHQHKQTKRTDDVQSTK